MQITFTKNYACGGCEWTINCNGNGCGEIQRKWAVYRSGDKQIAGYSVAFDHRSCSEWFPANGNARQALAQAKAYAAKVAASMVNA
jgi:hypothetical protein